MSDFVCVCVCVILQSTRGLLLLLLCGIGTTEQFLGNGSKEVVGPFDVEDTEDTMDGQKDNGPMENCSCFGVGRVDHGQKDVENGGVDTTTNGHPRDIKGPRHGPFGPTGHTFPKTPTTSNQKPRVNLHSQTSTHEPTILGPYHGIHQIKHNQHMVLNNNNNKS